MSLRNNEAISDTQPQEQKPAIFKPPLDVFFLDIPASFKYADNLPKNYKLPEHLWWAGYYTSTHLEQLKEYPKFFHGTRLSRIAGIQNDGGLKLFPESSAPEKLHSVYATPDPVLAAYHAYKNGPEDSNNQSFDNIDPDDPVIILEIDHSKYLSEGELEKYNSIARHTYSVIERGSESNYVGVRMGAFVPIEALSVLLPSAEDGVAYNISLEQYDLGNVG